MHSFIEICKIIIPFLLGYFGGIKQFRLNFIEKQIVELYSPLVSIRKDILESVNLRLEISLASDATWKKKVKNNQWTTDSIKPYEKTIEFDNNELKNRIVPLYKKMKDICVNKSHLAEKSTKEYFPLFYRFVNLWDRHLNSGIPIEVIIDKKEFQANEKTVIPFYMDLEKHLNRLVAEKKKWWKLWHKNYNNN